MACFDNQITKSNLSFKKNNFLILKEKMYQITVNEVKDYIIRQKLLDKI